MAVSLTLWTEDARRGKRARREDEAGVVLETPQRAAAAAAVAAAMMMSDYTDDVPVATPAPPSAPPSDADVAGESAANGSDDRDDARALPLDGVRAWHARWCLRGATVAVRAGGVGMRVHQAVLARYSEVWRDLWALPAFEGEGEGEEGMGAGAGARETAGGLPVVDVTESAEAWDVILTALYHP